MGLSFVKTLVRYIYIYIYLYLGGNSYVARHTMSSQFEAVTAEVDGAFPNIQVSLVAALCDSFDKSLKRRLVFGY